MIFVSLTLRHIINKPSNNNDENKIVSKRNIFIGPYLELPLCFKIWTIALLYENF